MSNTGRGLRGLPSIATFKDLPDNERATWLNSHDKILKAQGVTNPFAYEQMVDRFYKNEKFKEKFSNNKDYNLLKGLSPEQRDGLMLDAATYEAYDKAFSPYTGKADKFGNPLVDPNKGMGNAEDYLKYRKMSPEYIRELLASDWLPVHELEEKLKKEEKARANRVVSGYTGSASPNPITLGFVQSGAVMGDLIANETVNERSRMLNKDIIDRIYNKSLKKAEEEALPDIQKYKEDVINKVKDTDIRNQFMEAITQSENNMGNGQLKAYFHDDGTVEKEVADYSIDDMRDYLARKQVLEQKLGIERAHDALVNSATEYISDHQGFWTTVGLGTKDLLIRAAANTADKVNSVRQLYDLGKDAITGDNEVWQDVKGNVIDPDKIVTDKRGSYYTDDNGEEVGVRKVKMSSSTLDQMGKDSQGRDRWWFFNNKFWSDAERFKTMDEEEQKQYAQLGYSPYQVVFKPGEGSTGYETAMMSSFALADGLAMAMPVGGQSLGLIMQGVKGANMTAKATQAAGKAIYGISKVGEKAVPAISASAIGHAYGRGVFEESLQKNMQTLEENTYNRVQESLKERYTNDAKFKKQFDNDVYKRTQELKRIQAAQLKDSGAKIADSKANEKILRQRAVQEVLANYTNNEYKAFQNTQSYADDVAEATSSAGQAAMITSITDGAKYGLVNYGWRSFMFRNPLQRTKDAAAKLANNVNEHMTEKGARLTFKETLNTFKGKAKYIAKNAPYLYYNSGWTNYTDEMQAAGGRQINEDRFSAYLSGKYDGDAEGNNYDIMSAVNSYFTGAFKSAASEQAVNAFNVGGLGGIFSFAPNVSSIMHTVSTKEGRKAWREANFREKVNMLIANGVLNEYYAKKAAEKDLAAAVDLVNKVLDDKGNFDDLNHTMAIDLAEADVTDITDDAVVKYLKALNAMQVLKRFEPDESTTESSEEMALLGAAQKSSVIQDALQKIHNIANGRFTDAEAEEFLEDYYAANPTIPKSAANNAVAMELMHQRANDLVKAEEKLEEINSILNNYEKENGESINPKTRNRLVQRAAVGTFLDESISNLEKSITGSTKVSESETPIEAFGSKTGIKKQIRAYDRTKSALQKSIEEAERKLEESRKEMQSFIDSHKDNFSDADVELLKALSDKVRSDELEVEYRKEILSKVQDKTKFLEETESTGRVLTKDEILRLNPVDRARMLNPDNIGDYTKEQQRVIEALKKELTLRDPNLLKSIDDVARLQQGREANQNAHYMMLNNPDAAAVQLEAIRDHQAIMNVDKHNRNNAEIINATIKKIEALPNVTEDMIKSSLYKQLRVLNPSILKYLNDTKSNEKGLELVPKYAVEITKALDWSNLLVDISKAISSLGLEENSAKALGTNIDNLIENAETKDDVLKIFKNITESNNVNATDKNIYKKLLNMLSGVDSQRNSTTVDNKTKEKAREVKNDTEVEQQKKSIEVAEKEASNEEQAKKAIAQQQAEDIAEAERLKKQEEMAKAQLSQVETAEEREKRKQTEMQTYNLTEEEWENKEKQVSTVETPEEAIKNGEDVFGDESTDGYDFSTPTLEEQANDSNRGTVEAPVIITEITTDATDQGNLMSSADGLIGNAIYRYDLNKLVNEATEVNRVGAKADDPLNKFLNWMDTAGVKYQEIIDNELSDILKVQPKLNVMYINGQDNATHDNYIGDSPLLVVEYTNEISRIHKDERGGVFQANGKQYLVVGTLGFPRGSHGDIYRALRARHKDPRKAYFAKNPSERFWVVSNEYTEVKQFTSGRIVRQTLNDSKQEIRSVSQLLQDSQRNPKGLKMNDLKWGIQFDTKFATVGVSSRNTVYPPRDTKGNAGKTFLLIEAANGNYIPAAIEAVRWNSNQKTGERGLKDGTLKNQIMSLISELASTKYEDRRRAIDALVKLFYLSKDGDQILIGDKDKPGVPVVSTSKNGVILRSFKLDSETFSIGDLHAAIEELNPRINITTSMLSNPTMLKILDEAGALETDIAKLGTSNSGYSVYDIGADGMPIKDTTVSNGTPNIDANSDLEKYNNKKEHSVTYLGKTYRERNGKWYNNTWNEVTDPILIEQLQYNNIIRRRDLSPDFVEGTSEYFILNNDSINLHVIRRNASNMSINTLTEREAKVIVAEMNKRKLEQEKKDRAKAILQSEQAVEVDLGDTETTEVTPENIVTGTESQEEIVSNTTVNPAEEVVDEIVTNSRGIHLTDDGKFYVDESGKQYARVTSVISATEGAERMTPDNPWVTPSTTIGTGIDEFVRDFFAKKLGNTDSLSDRYPNATNKQLNEFRKQLEGLRRTFEEKELTVVPRDVTVTGTIEVTDSQGKKYNLDVAGTLDLLAYDTKGNFYIFDMKTSRSKPGHEKGVKWSKQLSLYKQFLESKYGVNVKGTEIIPIQVSYPAPKGFGNSKNEYTTKDGKLYMNGTEYREATPILHNNIPIPTSEVDIKYNLLTNDEVGLLKPLPDGTIDANTGVEKTEVVKTPENSSKVEEQSLAQLQQRKGRGGEPINATSLYRDREFRGRFKEVLNKKGFTGKPSEVNTFLESLNMPTTNITDINAWLDMLENCR